MSFENLNINIRDNRFSIILYDKRDDFIFFVVRKSYLRSNFPSNVFCSGFEEEIS